MKKLDRVAIKTRIMKDALDGKIEYPAKLLSYIDALTSIFENPNAEIYTENTDIAKAASYIGEEDILTSRINFIKLSKNVPEKAFFWVAEEKTDDMFNFFGIVDKVARGDLKNVYATLFESSIDPTPFNTMWITKDISKRDAVMPYFKVIMMIGQGWGKLENNLEALTTKVDHELYDLCIKNMPEIETRRQKQVDDYLLQQKNENGK